MYRSSSFWTRSMFARANLRKKKPWKKKPWQNDSILWFGERSKIPRSQPPFFFSPFHPLFLKKNYYSFSPHFYFLTIWFPVVGISNNRKHEKHILTNRERDASARMAKPRFFSSSSLSSIQDCVPAGSRRVENPFGALSLERFLVVYTVQDCYCGEDYHPTLGCCWVSAGPDITTTGHVYMNVMEQDFTYLPVHGHVILIVPCCPQEAVDPELILGARGVSREYILDEMPVEQTHNSPIHIQTLFWGNRKRNPSSWVEPGITGGYKATFCTILYNQTIFMTLFGFGVTYLKSKATVSIFF